MESSSGPTPSSLGILNASEDDIGFYSVAVFNPAGSVISAKAKVDLIDFGATIADDLIIHLKLDGNATNSGSDSATSAVNNFGAPSTGTFGSGKVGQALELPTLVGDYVFIEDYTDI